MVDDSKLITERIIYLIDEKNITLNRLATLSSVRQSTINSIVNGESKNPKISTIRKICKGLDVSLKDFFDFPPYNEV